MTYCIIQHHHVSSPTKTDNFGGGYLKIVVNWTDEFEGIALHSIPNDNLDVSAIK